MVELEPGAKLPEGTPVHVEVVTVGGADSLDKQADVFRMGEEALETSIPDLATNADHYLYGHPKIVHGR